MNKSDKLQKRNPDVKRNRSLKQRENVVSGEFAAG